MKKHFAFVSAPAHGHINPTLPVVEELVRRGHRVTYGTNEAFADILESSGATVVPLSASMPEAPSTFEFSPEHMVMMAQRLIGDARVDLPTMFSRLQADPADAVCFDAMSLTGRFLGPKLDVPRIALLPSFAANEQFSIAQEFSASEFDSENHGLKRMSELFQEFAAEHGESGGHPMLASPEDLNLVFIPRTFQLAADTFDDRFCFVGPSFGSRGAEKYDPIDDGKPLLFVSLGTAFNDRPEFFRVCLDAFAGSEWQVAMSIGDRIDVDDLGRIPGNIDVRRSFPQPAVLGKARLFLSHAGMNSVMESLYSKVPLLTLPQMPEQRINARRVEELGLGRQLAEFELDPEVLPTVVDEVSANASIRNKVAAMSEQARSAGGAVAAADALERHLDS